MLNKIIYVTIILIFLAPVAITPHGDKKEVKKVTATTIMNRDDDHEYSDSLKQVEELKTMKKDFAEIHDDVEESTVPTVIKALSLASIIAGLAFFYIPKKKKR
ncbi:MAG TPA: hypothetical protein ENI57_02320 [Ignavibacteria bacterium]|nr:hypothetical protein [Ignavibacteria bacterium]